MQGEVIFPTGPLAVWREDGAFRVEGHPQPVDAREAARLLLENPTGAENFGAGVRKRG
jgi:hypothetical protein